MKKPGLQISHAIVPLKQWPIHGVQDTGESFFEFSQFFSNFNPLQQPLKQQSIKKQSESLSYCTNTLDSCFKKFPNFIISFGTPGVQDIGESF